MGAWHIERFGRCACCNDPLTREFDRQGIEVGGNHVEGSDCCDFCQQFSPIERILTRVLQSNGGYARSVIADLRAAGIVLSRMKP